MSLLKRIPLRFKGELHNIALINFSVDIEEIQAMVPAGIKPKNFNGRALISMVNVQLKKMRPVWMPQSTHFNYQHIGFRLLVEDKQYHGGTMDQGIYFLDSFTNKGLMVWGGSMLTDYRLQKAELWNEKGAFTLRRKDKILSYRVDESHAPESHDPELLKTVGAIDRAYSKLGKDVRVTQIMREKWPLAPLKVEDFKTNFFETARLEGAFHVPEVIYYQWLPPKKVVPLFELNSPEIAKKIKESKVFEKSDEKTHRFASKAR